MKPGFPELPGDLWWITGWFIHGLALQVISDFMFTYQPHVLIVPENYTGKLKSLALKIFAHLLQLSGSLHVNLIAYVHICPKNA